MPCSCPQPPLIQPVAARWQPVLTMSPGSAKCLDRPLHRLPYASPPLPICFLTSARFSAQAHRLPPLFSPLVFLRKPTLAYLLLCLHPLPCTNPLPSYSPFPLASVHFPAQAHPCLSASSPPPASLRKPTVRLLSFPPSPPPILLHIFCTSPPSSQERPSHFKSLSTICSLSSVERALSVSSILQGRTVDRSASAGHSSTWVRGLRACDDHGWEQCV